MGVSIRYQAFPTRSGLYIRLQTDEAFNALLAALFPYGCGVLHLLAHEPDEAAEILKEAVDRHEGALGPEPEARKRVEESWARPNK